MMLAQGSVVTRHSTTLLSDTTTLLSDTTTLLSDTTHSIPGGIADTGISEISDIRDTESVFPLTVGVALVGLREVQAAIGSVMSSSSTWSSRVRVSTPFAMPKRSWSGRWVGASSAGELCCEVD